MCHTIRTVLNGDVKPHVAPHQKLWHVHYPKPFDHKNVVNFGEIIYCFYCVCMLSEILKDVDYKLQDTAFLSGDFNAAGIDQKRSLRQYIEEAFGYEHSFRWPSLGILLAFVVVMRLSVALATKTLQWQKR